MAETEDRPNFLQEKAKEVERRIGKTSIWLRREKQRQKKEESERERNRVRVAGIETDGKWEAGKNSQLTAKDGGALGERNGSSES